MGSLEEIELIEARWHSKSKPLGLLPPVVLLDTNGKMRLFLHVRRPVIPPPGIMRDGSIDNAAVLVADQLTLFDLAILADSLGFLGGDQIIVRGAREQRLNVAHRK